METKKNNNSYKHIKLKSGWYLHHRYVVEKFIERKLKPSEVVHHIDYDKTNNSINNLMIFDNQKEHVIFHIYFDKYGFNQRVRRLIRDRWKKYKVKRKHL